MSSRIAFVSGMAGSPWGGAEILWSETARKLLSAGSHVFASVHGWKEVPSAILTLAQEGAIVDRRDPRPPNPMRSLAMRLRRHVLGLPHHALGWQRLLKFRPDLVCVSHGGITCGLEWMLKCHQAGIPYVSISQANADRLWPDDKLADHIRIAYANAIKTFFVSRANLKLLEIQIGERLRNAEVIWNPFNVPYDSTPPWPASNDEISLACVGRLEPFAKGQDLLFEVLSQQKWRQRPLRVALYGSGSCEQTLRRLVAFYDLSSTVEFKGHVSDITALWARHHALVLPSRYEGLPIALVEAMLCGRLAIVTDVAGNCEVIQDEITGFVAQSAHPRHLDEAMERAWCRRSEWQVIGRNAAEQIRNRVPRDPAGELARSLSQMVPRPYPMEAP